MSLRDFLDEFKSPDDDQQFMQEEEGPDASSEPEIMSDPTPRPPIRRINRNQLRQPLEREPPELKKPPMARDDQPTRLMNAFKNQLTQQLAIVRREGKTPGSIDALVDWYEEASDKLTFEMEQNTAQMETGEYKSVSTKFNRFMGAQSTRVNRMIG
jgi:hypothetical protein